MNTEKKQIKSPITQEAIFRIMMTMTFIVGSVFFLKNIVSKSYQGAFVVGICLVVFAIIIFGMRKLNVDQYKRQFVLCIGLVILVFLISANSGSFYSDDFPLFLAILGLAGMYLEPKYTIVQAILATVCLIVLYMLHPEKADPLSQYIMCLALFDVTAFTIYLAIKRGRSFIDVSMMRAAEAEKLLASIKAVGEELNENYEQSNERIKGLREVNRSLEENVSNLTDGSETFRQRTQEVEAACDEVQMRMQITENNIGALNAEVKKVEAALAESKRNMKEMDVQMKSVDQIVQETNEVFALLGEQMQKISGMTAQLTSIATTTRILALNASIEAARAGKYGAGFAVVASEVQELANNSNDCSEQVVEMVESMRAQIDISTNRLADSAQAITSSLKTLDGLEQGFHDLMKRFDSLYGNIEEQNENVNNMDAIFGELKGKVSEMSAHSEENSAVVDSIVEAIARYKTNTNQIVHDATQIHDLSSSMLDVSLEKLS